MIPLLVLVPQPCPVLCDPMDCSLPGSSVHGILQARILKWVAIPFSRGSCPSRDWTWVSHNAGRFFTIWATKGSAKGKSPNGKSCKAGTHSHEGASFDTESTGALMENQRLHTETVLSCLSECEGHSFSFSPTPNQEKRKLEDRVKRSETAGNILHPPQVP